MHIHQSVVDSTTGKNLFANANGRDSAMFKSFIAGLARYMPQVAPLWAPNVNSFRRMRPDSAAPINVQWGVDNRSCGFRVPVSDRNNRRVENRLPGADSNPYLRSRRRWYAVMWEWSNGCSRPSQSKAAPITAPALCRVRLKRLSTVSPAANRAQYLSPTAHRDG